MARTGRPREFDLEEALATALQLFWEHGYESTSLAQLRSALGISSASFYNAFSSKEDLFKKVVERYANCSRSSGRPTAGTS
jgi:TetR/AcrR family transcriptional regulator, copper-responsive repressor